MSARAAGAPPGGSTQLPDDLQKYKDLADNPGSMMDPKSIEKLKELRDKGLLPPEQAEALNRLIEGGGAGSGGEFGSSWREGGVEYRRSVDLDKNAQFKNRRFLDRDLPDKSPNGQRDKGADPDSLKPVGLDRSFTPGGLNLNERGSTLSHEEAGDIKNAGRRGPGPSGAPRGGGPIASSAGGSPSGRISAGQFKNIQFRSLSEMTAKPALPDRARGAPVGDFGSPPSEGTKGSPTSGLDAIMLEDPEPSSEPVAREAARETPEHRTEKYRRRESEALSLLRENPSDTGALNTLAQSQIAQGKYEGAIETASESIAKDSKNAEARVLRAIANEQLGNRDRKLYDLRIAAALAPVRFNQHNERAKAGERIFDPGFEDSWFLLEAVVRQGAPARSAPKGPFLVFGVIGLAAFGAAMLWRHFNALSQRQRRALASNVNRVVRGQVLPQVGREDLPRSAPPRAPPAPEGASDRFEVKGIFAGKYRLVNALGRDGDAEVWKALDTTLDRPALIKRFYPGEPDSPKRVRLLDCSRKAAALHHPNIVDTYEILERSSGLCVVYEYASGTTLRKVLKEVGKLSVQQARDILVPVCRALEHGRRQGIAHGGLSPERILVTPEGYIKTSDFVIAREVFPSAAFYFAPEIPERPASTLSDVYSLALIFVEMISGTMPVRRDDRFAWDPGIELYGEASDKTMWALERLAVESLDPDPLRRPSDPLDMIERLQKIPLPSDRERRAVS